MNKVIFSYEGAEYEIECKENDIIKDIVAKFLNIINMDRRFIYFISGGKLLNDELPFNKCVNKKKIMRVLAYKEDITTVKFLYNGAEYIIECDQFDKMKVIADKFYNKFGLNRKNKFLLYGENIINEELSFNKCASKLDLMNKVMSVIVMETQDSNDNKTKLVKSKYIICPKCHENAFILIDNFKITIAGCKLGHKIENLQISEFEKTQYIEQSKINITSQFDCKIHNEKYINYCSDCKLDLCASCIKEHLSHNLLVYSDRMPDINILKKEDLTETGKMISQFKDIIKSMIDQLNNLNQNLDKYFDIYSNLISNFDSKKTNNYQIQNINNMKKFNDNFLGNLSEIIKDKNLKYQFMSIISIQSKIQFIKLKKHIEIIRKNDSRLKVEKNEIKDENNNIINNNYNDNNIDNGDNENDNDDADNNIQDYNPLNDKYEKFNLSQMKELQSFNPKNEISELCLLNDGRILSNQIYHKEDGEDLYKLCVYSTKKGFICDINIDFDLVKKFYPMNDGNVVVLLKQIKIIKINKKSIEEIWVDEKKRKKIRISKLLNNNFFVKSRGDMTQEGLYKYDKDKLLLYKDLHKLYVDEKICGLIQLTEDEYALASIKKGKIYGENNYLIFYDMKNDKKIKTLKLGDGEKMYNDFLSLNKDNLIVIGMDYVILVDVKNKKVIKEFKYAIDLDEIIILNEKKFLYSGQTELLLYELDKEDNLILKEKKDMEISSISKYPGNKLIIFSYEEKKISIYGCD